MPTSTVMYGRTIQLASAAWDGTFTDGVKTFITICVSEYPEVSYRTQELEVTSSCSPTAAIERIAGLADGQEITFRAHYEGSSETDWGIGATTLWSKALSGATVGFKDSSAQTILNGDLVLRYDVTLLGATYMGGPVGDVQDIMVTGRITGSINGAAS
jgi:hypothetical protein